MEKLNDQNPDKKRVPDTTHKEDGTTSAFSAASLTNPEDEAVDSDRKSYLEDGEQGRASFHPGSTTQGGSNYGQGSSSLGPSSYQQGSETGKGANYDNEAGRFAETGTGADGTAQPGENTDLKKQGGTETEEDEFGGTKRKSTDEGKETAGIP